MTGTPWGGLVSYRAVTESTMDDAQVLEDQGLPDGSVAWAGFQTAGRGRHRGRTWEAAAGANLLFTVFWKSERLLNQRFAASLTVGLGVCLWLEALSLDPSLPIRLKWPNDVYLGERKVAGILVRRRVTPQGLGSIHAGIGINLITPQGAFRTDPTSVAEAGRALSPSEALEGLLPFLAAALNQGDPRTLCVERLWRRDQALSLTLPDGRRLEGFPRGLDDDGSLLWDGENGLESLSSAE